jgi:nitrite reductase/ring-hydroxylating ferredoxin subunit
MEQKYFSVKDLAPGKMAGINIDGKDILVANAGGVFFAIGNICTHRGCRLSNGTLTGENIHCPCHGSTFNVRTGEVIKGPAARPEPTYRISYESGDVRVNV